MHAFIQAEYDFFLTGKANYRLLLLDSFTYLLRHKLLVPTKEEIKDAYLFVRQERIDMMRHNTFQQDELRATYWTPNTSHEKRQQENKFRMWQTMQLLVYRWYEKQKKAGVKLIHVHEAHEYMIPKIQYS